jgi:hypothetical protein
MIGFVIMYIGVEALGLSPIYIQFPIMLFVAISFYFFNRSIVFKISTS